MLIHEIYIFEKMITSEKGVFEAQFENFFILWKSHVLFMDFFLHFLTCANCAKSRKASHIFWNVHKSDMKFDQETDIALDNISRKYFARFGGWELKPGTYIYQPTANNQEPITMNFLHI